MTLFKRLFLAFALIAAVAVTANAQTPARDARLVLTAADQTGGVLPGATVTITGIEDATKTPAPIVTRTADRGVATVDNLAAGKYSVRVEMDGFNPTMMPDLKIAKGENKRTITMALKSMTDSVTVQVDKQSAALDRNFTFGSALTREQIEALPDDPVELEKVLKEMGGPDAVIRVDSFEGSQLPHKSQIKAIHISRDQFAAENHFAGGIHIDIVTQAGSGPFRMNSSYNVRDSSLDGKNQLVAAKGPTRNQNVNFGGSGTLIPNRLSASVNGGMRNSFNTPLLSRQGANGPSYTLADIRSRGTGYNVYADMTYALTKDQTLRVYFSQNNNDDKNMGVGGYNSIDRAYSSKSKFGSIRGQEAGPLGRRFVTNTKFSYSWTDQSTTSASDALTQIVNEEFTIGGAQRKGGRRTKEYMLQSDLDYVRGMHTVRVGALINGGSYHSDDSTNFVGTYVFDSNASFLAGKPRSFTKRVGDPLIDYSNTQVGVYVQDDIRVRKNLSFSPGIRYEVQTHLRDYAAIGPRFGLTWAPFKSGKTSLRASWGIFYDWFGANVYEQTLRIDGFRQRELIISNPVYPNAGAEGVLSSTNRYLVDPDLKMSRNQRVSAGFDQTFTPRMRMSATYSYTKIDHAFRGENLNTPVKGVRSDPNFANVIRVLSDGQAIQHQLSVNGSWQFAAPSAALQAARFNIRRGSINVNFNAGKVRNNFDGAFQAPTSGDISNEWGPGFGDVRRRVNFGINSSALKNLNVGISVNASTGSPYNIITGLDDNGDLIFNDRPIGFERNAGRGKGQWSANANLSYNITFGKNKGAAAGGPAGMPGGPIMIMGGDMRGMAEAMVRGAGMQQPGRYRLSIFLNASNLTNHANPVGWVGNMRSSNFGGYTTLQGVRQVNIGVNFGF